MLKKLKFKFILLSMVAVFIVLATTITAINISNYAVIEKNSKTTLVQVIEHGLEEEGPLAQMNKPPQEGGQPPEDQQGPQGQMRFRDSSFFISVFDKDGNIVKSNYFHVFLLDEGACKNLSLEVYNGELKGRRYGTFRFTKTSKDDGLTYVAFVDVKKDLDNANSFLLLSSLISIGAYAVLTGLIVVAANIAFKPSEEAYKKQKKFITNASHELKTPLTVISADLDLVEMDNGKSEWTDSIRSQVDRLTCMTKQLVELSRLGEEDTSNYPFEDFSVNEVCNKAIQEFEPLFKKEGIKFAHNVTGNLTIFGSKYLVEDLIHIFLDNSLKYTGGENKSSYFVVSENDKGKVEFKFSKTLDKDDETDVKQVLERFYRSPSNKKEGSGLGLSIAQEILNLHKGKIKVDKNNSSISFVITFD